MHFFEEISDALSSLLVLGTSRTRRQDQFDEGEAVRQNSEERQHTETGDVEGVPAARPHFPRFVRHDRKNIRRTPADSTFLGTAFAYSSNGSAVLNRIADTSNSWGNRKASSLLLRAHPRVPVGPVDRKDLSHASRVCALRRN